MIEPKSKVRQAAGSILTLLLFLSPFSKAAIEILFPILLVIWLIGWKRYRFEDWRQIPLSAQKVHGLLLLYLFACLASVFYSVSPELSLRGFVAKTLEYILLYFIAADVMDQPGTAQRCVRILLFSGGLTVLLGLIQEWAIFTATYKPQAVDPFSGQTLDYARMVGPYENPNDLATFLMVTSLIAIVWSWKATAGGKRIFYSILTVFLAGCLIWTRSLGALLGFAAGLAALALSTRLSKTSLLILGGVFAVGSGLFILFSPENFLQLITLSDLASMDRANMWKTGWAMWMDRPILGHGLNTFMHNYAAYSPDPSHHPAYAHNCFLQIAAETGVIGLSFFLLFLAGLCRLTLKALHAPAAPGSGEAGFLKSVLLAFSAALLAFLIQSIVDTNLYALRQAVLFWTLAGMMLGVSIRLLRPRPGP